MNYICPNTNRPCEVSGCNGTLCNPIMPIPQQKQTPLYGWECPRCFKIHSPFSLTCDCPPRTFTSGGNTNTFTFYPVTQTNGGLKHESTTTDLIDALIFELPMETKLELWRKIERYCTETNKGLNEEIDKLKNELLSK